VQWISNHCDPIPWRHLASDVSKNGKHPGIAKKFAIADTVAKDE